MTKSFDSSVPFPDSSTARTHRQLRCVKALFKIDDAELEQVLVVMLERLAANQTGLTPSVAPDAAQPQE